MTTAPTQRRAPRKAAEAAVAPPTGQAKAVSQRTARVTAAAVDAVALKRRATAVDGVARKRPAKAIAPAHGGSATLSIDVGGTGLKASVLDIAGKFLHERVRVDTPYPCPPATLVAALVALVEPLPAYDRISVGFPGMVRAGKTLSAPNLSFAHPGDAERDPELVQAWHGFDLGGALEAALKKPVRVANDADVQGSAVVQGEGLELVVTLGTGFGTSLFINGQLAPHLEISQSHFRNGETFDEQIGDVTRKRIGKAKWNKRVALALQALDALMFYDHVYIGGGNSHRLTFDIGPKATVIDNTAGILGGIRLWDRDIV
jgi:polyphosphate glucokinase